MLQLQKSDIKQNRPIYSTILNSFCLQPSPHLMFILLPSPSYLSFKDWGGGGGGLNPELPEYHTQVGCTTDGHFIDILLDGMFVINAKD